MVLHAIVYGLDEVLAIVYARCGAAAFDVDEELLDVAAWNGHLKCVQFLHSHLKPHGGGCTAFAIDLAAARGHLEIVRFLHEDRSGGCTVEGMDLAAKFGHFRIVQFPHTHRSEGSAWRGHLEIVQFLHSHRREGCTGRALVKAAANGKADVVRFLLEHRDEGCFRRALAAYPKPFVRNILVDRLKSDGCPCHACAGRDGYADGVWDDILAWLWCLCTCGGLAD
ncbi:hypothetical protein AC1031_004407 [Aphanomyces cochlioides]|nr:hypothetical protein AC1031_004407 [Aphanomyces cochlioides]